MSDVELVEVASAEAGMRLDRWFRAHYPSIAHGALQKLLRTGQIRVDGGRAKANARLAAGQQVRVPPVKFDAVRPKARRGLSAEDRRFIQSLVIHKDKDILALNKPAGLAVQGGTGTTRHIDKLLDGLQFDASERPRLVHRLDKDTSGVLLLARNRAAASALGDTLKDRAAIKTYWALLKGVPSPRRGEISLRLVKKGGAGAERIHIAEEGEAGAMKAITRYAVIEPAGSKLCWAALWPLTGRTHQLRVHLAAIGHPIVGDGKYGGSDAHPGGDISGKLHLHARKIEIPHPSGGNFRISARLPDHMLKTWKLFGFDPDLESEPFEDEV
ncbi:MAG TPA: RluA family pseudouridine synthase [Rhizobiales bacterium]|nr:RluA family pseudouridine synthase [Hyphomicrobiales bacterium]